MKQKLLTWLLLLWASAGYAQIPFEVLVGHRQTQYFNFIQKDLDTARRWNVFSQTLFSVDYRDPQRNALAIENQLTYQLTPWFGLAAGGGYNGQRFTPSVGLSLGYTNKANTLFLGAYPMVDLGPTVAFDIFAFIVYTPAFTERWGLFSQLFVGSVLGNEQQSRDTELFRRFSGHIGSSQMLRLGLNYRQKFQFGFGIDLLQTGPTAIPFENAGVFVRYQID